MDSQFWNNRWQQNQIAFHQKDFNSYLLQFGYLLPKGPVLVPLCGKSRDMLYLASEHEVIGCEFIESAVEAFFQENMLSVVKTTEEAFTLYKNEGIRIYAGDFFALSTARTGAISSVFDRAAIVALPESMRQKYLEHMLSFLAPGGVCLLVGLRYENKEASGPPFSIPLEEVSQRIGSRASISFLQEADVLMGRPDLQARGFTVYREWVALLTSTL